MYLKEFIVLFRLSNQPAESSLKRGDVRHSRIRRQGGRKAGLTEEQWVHVGPQMSNNWYCHLNQKKKKKKLEFGCGTFYLSEYCVRDRAEG